MLYEVVFAEVKLPTGLTISKGLYFPLGMPV